MRFSLAALVLAGGFFAACSSATGPEAPTATPGADSTAAGDVTPTATSSGGGADVPAWHSFYIEAEITVRSNAATAGATVATDATPAEGPRGFESVTHTTIRWSSESLRFFRQELSVQPEDGASATTQIIGDGDRIVFYDEDANTYRYNNFPAQDLGLIAVPIPASIVLGPPADTDDDAPFEAAMTMIQGVTNRPEGIVDKGTDTVAGRETRVFETGYAVCHSANDGTSRECRGDVTVWVDAETGFILRYEAADPGELEVVVNVTRIEYGPTFERAAFTFTPPPGATRVE
jgi:outer membrane lipoprotein-sorting protein